MRFLTTCDPTNTLLLLIKRQHCQISKLKFQGAGDTATQGPALLWSLTIAIAQAVLKIASRFWINKQLRECLERGKWKPSLELPCQRRRAELKIPASESRYSMCPESLPSRSLFRLVLTKRRLREDVYMTLRQAQPATRCFRGQTL